MTNAERAAVLKRMVTVLKKNFKVERLETERTPIEQLIYSICLENASFSAADDVYNALTHNYFDWNEVRVSSSRELAETMKNLPEPAQTGLRLKRILHYIFDQKYAFEIDEIKKMSVKAFNEYVAKMENVTPFNSAYVMMTVMGRHAIPVSSGEFEVLDILGLIDKKDREKNSVSWLERVIEKKKANEFFSLLHQLAALYVKNPYGRKVMEILVAIDPKCKDNIPKRRKSDEEVQPTLPELTPAATAAESKPEPEVKAKPEAKPAEKPEAPKPAAEKKPVAEKKPAAEKKVVVKKTTEKKPAATEKKSAAEKKPVEKKPVAEKKPAAKKATAEKKPAAAKKTTAEKKPAPKKTVAEKKPASVKKTTPEKKSAPAKTAEKKTAVTKSTAAKSAPAKSAKPKTEAKSAKSSPAQAKKPAAKKAETSKASKAPAAKTTKKSK